MFLVTGIDPLLSRHQSPAIQDDGTTIVDDDDDDDDGDIMQQTCFPGNPEFATALWCFGMTGTQIACGCQ